MIYSALATKTEKKIAVFQTKTKDFVFYLAIMPFEFIAEAAAAQAASDMIVRNDLDSSERNEPKEARSTVSFIPAKNFDSQLQNEVLEFANHKLSENTYFAARMHIYKGDELIPFFGTLKFDNGKWEYLNRIEQNVLAYEFLTNLSGTQTSVQSGTNDLN